VFKSPTSLVACAALALGLLLSACGGEAVLPSRSMTVVGREMAFDAPDRVEPGEYQIVFRNTGAEFHELAIKNSSGDVMTRRSIAGGATATMKVRLDPGTYELGCFEPGHYAGGMHQMLVVAAT
jgi:uncharacterized cupredoxin-like copper-binding protein